MTNETQTRADIIAASYKAREQEVMLYQINIDNYSLAIKEIASLPADEQVELSAFLSQLEALLASEMLEQKKSKIMLSVLKQQMEV